MMFGLLFGSDIHVWKIVLISLIWETFEHFYDAARLTDPIVNTLGFIFGKYLRLLIILNHLEVYASLEILKKM